jgi:chromosome segregation ATPase
MTAAEFAALQQENLALYRQLLLLRKSSKPSQAVSPSSSSKPAASQITDAKTELAAKEDLCKQAKRTLKELVDRHRSLTKQLDSEKFNLDRILVPQLHAKKCVSPLQIRHLVESHLTDSPDRLARFDELIGDYQKKLVQAYDLEAEVERLQLAVQAERRAAASSQRPEIAAAFSGPISRLESARRRTFQTGH